jgi:hypothetical protein
MRAIKKAEKIIEKDITKPFAKLLAQLIVSLESDDLFQVKQLYDLSPVEFDLVIDILKEWRIDRHYMGKSKTFAAAYYASALTK